MNLRFENDIYVSYAHLDHVAILNDSRGWVDDLCRALQVRVSQLIGEPIRLWMDWYDLSGTSLADAHRRALSSSATMLCIVSPAYVRSDFCLDEFAEFVNNRVTQRDKLSWFKVVKYPVRFSELPRQLESVVGYQFFRTDEAGRVQPLEGKRTEAKDQQYWIVLNELAHDIASVLMEVRYPSPNSSSTALSNSEFMVSTSEQGQRQLSVFLCHSSEDKVQVRTLCDRLQRDGVDPWLDERRLLPGQKWADEIPKAVRNTDVVIVCMTQSSISKRGYLQKEVTFALDVAQEEPEGSIFLIPARLEECEVPERLRPYQWLNLYDEGGYALLLKALQARAGSLSVRAMRR